MTGGWRVGVTKSIVPTGKGRCSKLLFTHRCCVDEKHDKSANKDEDQEANNVPFEPAPDDMTKSFQW